MYGFQITCFRIVHQSTIQKCPDGRCDVNSDENLQSHLFYYYLYNVFY